jgi:hypothetical protein
MRRFASTFIEPSLTLAAVRLGSSVAVGVSVDLLGAPQLAVVSVMILTQLGLYEWMTRSIEDDAHAAATSGEPPSPVVPAPDPLGRRTRGT